MGENTGLDHSRPQKTRGEVSAAYSLPYTVGSMGTAKPRQTIAAGLLLDARRRAGLTQAEVALRAGVARSSISQYETGTKDPSVTTVSRLLAACGMEMHLHADPLTPAALAQALRDAAVGPAQARRNAKQARAGLVSLRPLTPTEKAAARGQRRV